MQKGVMWVIGAAVLVYLVLRPQRGKVGTTRTATAGPSPGIGAQVGSLVDGAWRVGKELFGSSGGGESTGTGPADLSGLTVAPGERADFI